jgi:serine/threonine protein kinase
MRHRSADDAVIIENGKLLLHGAVVRHYTILSKIGQGANGIVYKATNTILDRIEALKVWVKLRAGDNRDKITQGMLEAKMAANAAPEHAVAIYHAM